MTQPANVEARLSALEARMEVVAVDRGFAEMRAKLDQAAAGQQRIVDLLTAGIGA